MRQFNRFAAELIIGSGIAAIASTVYAQPCVPHWEAGWHQRGPGPNELYAQTTFDDGSGLALYVGGVFSTAGEAIASNVARWNGTQWQSLNTGLFWTGGNPVVRAFATFDAGNGPSLYAGGKFRQSGSGNVNAIARWNGSAWVSLGIPVTAPESEVGSMAVFDDDGVGPIPPRLYVSGAFYNVPGLGAGFRSLIKWDGTSWSAATAPPGILVAQVLKILDDGSGPALYAGGIDNGSPHAIRKWNGTTWTAVTGTLTGLVNDFTFFDHDGNGPAGPTLHVGGDFEISGPPAISDLARWDGAAWQTAGAPNDAINSLEAAGAALYAGGWFTQVGGIAASRVAVHDGSAWSALAEGGTDGVCNSVRQFDVGGGPLLYAAGGFSSAGSTVARDVARLTAGAWQSLGGGEGLSRSASGGGNANAFALHDDGSGVDLYVAGIFNFAGGIAANNIARRTMTGWEAMGTGLNGAATTLCVYDDQLGGGADLFVAGNFSSAGSVSVSKIARWTGSAWADVAGGVAGAPGDAAPVNAMAVFDEDGKGPLRPELFVAGAVLTAGGSPVSRIARWNGIAWSNAGATTNGVINGLATFDDGGGLALYASGGQFDATGANFRALAKWNDSTWVPVSPAPESGQLSALFAAPDGLYASGNITLPGGISMSGIVRWNSSGWTQIAGSVTGTTSFAIFDDGDGDKMYICGAIYGSGGTTSALAYWNGSSFVPSTQRLLTGAARVLFASNGDDLPGLWVGGAFFNQAGAVASPGLARYVGCTPCPADIAGEDGQVNVNDLLLVITSWGRCPAPPTPCPADTNNDGAVNVNDLLAVITNWGACP